MSPAHVISNTFHCVKYLLLIISHKGGGMLIAVFCHYVRLVYLGQSIGLTHESRDSQACLKKIESRVAQGLRHGVKVQSLVFTDWKLLKEIRFRYLALLLVCKARPLSKQASKQAINPPPPLAPPRILVYFVLYFFALFSWPSPLRSLFALYQT